MSLQSSMRTEKEAEEIAFHMIFVESGEKPKALRVGTMASHLTVSKVFLRPMLSQYLSGVLFFPKS